MIYSQSLTHTLTYLKFNHCWYKHPIPDRKGVQKPWHYRIFGLSKCTVENVIDGSSHNAWWEMWWMTAKTPNHAFLVFAWERHKKHNDEWFLLDQAPQRKCCWRKNSWHSFHGTAFTMWSRFTKQTASSLFSWQGKKIWLETFPLMEKQKIKNCIY